MSVNLDIKPAIREAIIGDMAISALLGQYGDSPSVHTTKPAPDGAEYPMVIVSLAIVGDADLVNKALPIAAPDIAVYGQNPRHKRVVDEIAFMIRGLFHRNRWAMDLGDYGLRMIETTVAGPLPAPTDDETTIGRVLIPTMRLEEI